MSHEPSGAVSSSAPVAAASGSVPMAVSSKSADERFRSDEVPDHGVKRVRWSPREQDTKEFDSNESSVQIPRRGLKRQPDSTTEDLEDAGDQENRGDDDDDDMKALGAVNEEPVITIGVNGETLDECESVEESYVDDVNGGFLDPEMVREARVEELAGYLKMQVYCRVPTRRSTKNGQKAEKPVKPPGHHKHRHTAHKNNVQISSANLRVDIRVNLHVENMKLF